MDDLFPILMFLIFVLGPIIEGIKRKNKQPPPTQRRMPPPPSRTEEISSKPRAENSATMVPDDLWEILTGQKRPPVLTTPRPLPPVEAKKQPWDVVHDPDEQEDEIFADDVRAEDVEVESRRQRVEAQSLETLERHPVPVVVSLEDNLPTVRQRHEAFHRKIATPDAVVARLEQRTRVQLKGRSDLQQAILLMEVLGKPKGLE